MAARTAWGGAEGCKGAVLVAARTAWAGAKVAEQWNLRRHEPRGWPEWEAAGRRVEVFEKVLVLGRCHALSRIR